MDMVMDAKQVRTLLTAAGFCLAFQDAQIEAREDRWAVLLPRKRMAWFPMNAEGSQRLATERRVLRLLQARCSFQAPRVLFVAEAGWEVRALVPGVCDPWRLFQQAQNDRALAQRIGRSLGHVLAEQHVRVRPEDAAGWLPRRLRWPKPREWVEGRLPHVMQDARLQRSIGRALRRYDDLDHAGSGNRVLVHGDLGLHNIAVDLQTAEVQGVFDYDGAAWADRHHDFCYLLFDREEDDMLEAALEAYEPALGIQLDRARIRLLNAACAVSFLAFRCGAPPEARPCGRTLVEDLNWVRHALQGAGEACP